MDNRQQIRVPVEPQCKARIRFEKQAFRDIPVSNLGTSGCCIHVPVQLANGLLDKAALDGLVLVHPSLPGAMVKAKVAWVQRRQDPVTGLVAAGVRFMAAPGNFTDDLTAFVRNWGRYQRLDSGFDGMPA
jgi:hypothetical protein